MNERIKELADKAKEYAEWSTPQGLEWFDNFKEQFADLIVRECAKVAHECIDDEWFDVGGAIKEHFGVK